MSRIRVLQVTHDLHPGGLQRVVDTLCRTIDRSRFDISVLCLRDRGALAGALEGDLGIPILQVHGDPRLNFLKTLRILLRHRVDVIHTHNTEPFTEATIAAMCAGIRTVVHTEHGREWPDRRIIMAIERMLSYYAYRIVAVSDDCARSLKRWERIPERKLLTIPNGISGSAYDARVDVSTKRRDLGVPEESVVVGYASRLEPEKDVELLIRAFAAVTAVDARAFLLIAGDGSERTRLEALAEQLEIGTRTRFLGVRSDVPELLKVFDLHVLSSRREGLPMILLESMSAGCPSVATAVGGIPSLIAHGKNGELVPAGDLGAMRDAILRLVRSPELREQYGRRGKELFAQQYEATIMTGRYELLYQRRADELRGLTG